MKSFKREGASKITGFIDIVEGEKWIAAVATNWWAANRALDSMSPVFETKGFLADSDKIDTALRAALDDGPGIRFVSRGDTNGVFEIHKND